MLCESFARPHLAGTCNIPQGAICNFKSTSRGPLFAQIKIPTVSANLLSLGNTMSIYSYTSTMCFAPRKKKKGGFGGICTCVRRSIAISCLTWLTVMQYEKIHFENVLCSAQMSFLVMCSDNTFYHIASLCNSAINVGQYQRI